jgi:hypothetical protein
MRSVVTARRALIILAILARAAGAQTDYRNLDAGRPLRIEDALVTPRWSFDVQLPSVRAERYGSGVTRWRAEPKVSYGIAPFTEVEVRVPVLYVIPLPSAGARTSGIAGVAVSVVHAFGVETESVPGLSLGYEALLPAGSLASPRTTHALKAVVSKTLALARIHVNAGLGSYSVRSTTADTACVRKRFVLPGMDPGCGAPVIPDVPCSIATIESSPAPDSPLRSAAMMCGGEMTAAAAAPEAVVSTGAHWSAAFGADHAFGLASTLVGADLVAERFVGLYALTDWTAEVGLRHQWSPRLVLDAGVARHLAGVLQSTAVTLGATYAFSFAH